MVIRRARTLGILLALPLLLAAGPASAFDLSNLYFSWTEFVGQFLDPDTGLTTLNTLLLPIGGNVEGMGTAYTAVAQDAGYIESNPAASSRLMYTELSLSHRDVIDDVSLDSVVYTMRVRNLGLGVAGKFLPIRFARNDSDGVQIGKAYITESVLILNGSYNLLSSYDFDGLALGGSLKVALRGVPGELLDAGLLQNAKVFDDQSALGVMVDLGVLTRVNFLKPYLSRSKNFSAGIALKNLGPNVLGDPLPTTLTAGIAYSMIRPLLLSLDVNVPLSFQAAFPAEDVNIATGLDIRVADFLSVQGGLWLRGANPRLSLGASVDLEAISIVVNSTLDLSGSYGIGDKLSVQARVNLGDQGRGKRQADIDRLFAEAFLAYSEGRLEDAVSYGRQVLELQKDHRHAQRLVDLATESIETQRRIREKQEEASGLLQQETTDGGGTQTPEGAPVRDEGLEN